MKTWKIVGITGLMLASLLWSGAAQAKRFDKHSPNCHNQVTYQPYGYHHDGYHAEADRRAATIRPERERHHHWERSHNRMARASHWW